MSRPDVVVVGAGIVGTSAAWELARRGAAVTLLDAGEVSGGTTGLGEGNVLCADKDAGPELDLTRLGLRCYDAIEAELGPVARIRRKGALIVHPAAETWAAEPARVARLRDAGVEAEELDPAQVRRREPRLLGPLQGATFVSGDLQCDPRAIARALADRAARLGAPVRTRTPVERVLVAGGRVRGVRLRGGEELAAGAVVVAAGPWSRALCEGAGVPLPLEPRKGQLVQLALPAPDPGAIRHKVVDGSYLLSVADPGAGRQVSSVVETTWDGHVVVGSSRERRGFDLEVDPAVSAAMVARAAKLFPFLGGLSQTRAWAGLRPWLPDHLPAIGASERVPGLWVATGHEGAGVALGPVTGLLVAQDLCGEPPAMDLAPFAPDRFALVAGRAAAPGPS